MNTFLPTKKLKVRGFITLIYFILYFSTNAQMRQLYVDNIADNHIYKMSYYSPSQGFVAFRDWIGYTTDSGRTFTKKYITIGNVNYNGFSVNLTFGFGISGVKAFNQNTIIAYGDYGFVPAILYSTDGGNSFTLVYHSQYNSLQLSTGITDIIFPSNGNIGYAIDADRILKTTNQGLSWFVIRTDPNSYFDYLEAVDDNNVFALCAHYNANKLLKTNNGGSNWQTVPFPVLTGGLMIYSYFLNANTGWLNMYDAANNHYLYKTLNGGINWTLQNNLEATPFLCSKMKFMDNNTGYAISEQNTIRKTFDGGATWEPLPRDNNYTYLGYSHNDLQCLTVNQLWAGGGHGFLEMSTNGGGMPIPKAYFRIDTTGLSITGNVNLLNYSRTGYSYKWFLNNVQISTSYNSSYIHDINRTKDTIVLVVSNGATTDTSIRYQYFFQPVIVSSFTPSTGATGTTVSITGINFTGVNSVSFGGVPVSTFNVLSPTSISAVIANGASGVVAVTTFQGTGALAGFTYYAAPTINLPTTVSDDILCKSESITVVLQNTEPNVRYDLIDSLNNSYGYINSNGGTVAIYTIPIIRTGNYKIKATRLNVTSTSLFTNNIFITVEHTKSALTANRVNIIPGEKINFTNHSLEAQNYNWIFNQDANISSSGLVNPQNIFYASSGQKTLSLISISVNGCRDTLSTNSAFVYNKPAPNMTCYVQNVDDSDHFYFPESPASMNRVALTHDNGYIISGFGNFPKLKSNIGTGKNFSTDGTAYLGKYTTDGVLSWFISIPGSGNFYGAEKDNEGNIYILGSCKVTKYLTLINGDSLRISATPTDTISYSNKVNGFILKLDSAGNYLWHTILDDPSPTNIGYPVQGGLPTRIKIEGGQIAISGSFLANLAYCKNGIKQNLDSLTNSIYANDNQNNFIIRIKEDGSLVWHMYFENDATNQLRDISSIGIDNSKNYYVSGYYENQVRIHDVGNVTNITYTGPVGDAKSYLLKFDSTGRLIWKVKITNGFVFRDIFISDMVVSPNGESYVTGSSSVLSSSNYFVVNNSDNSTANVSLGSYFLLKFDSSGIYKWGAGSRYSYYGQGNSVYVAGNNVYTTGTLSDNGPQSSSFTITSTDGNNINQIFHNSEYFIANYDTSGILKRITKSGQNAGGYLRPNHLIIDNSNNYIISGLEENWNGGTGSYTCFNSNFTTNKTDAFFNKINPDYCYSTVAPIADAGVAKVICSGDSTMIGTVAVSGNYYSWSGPAGFSSVLPNPYVSPSTTASYYLTVINNAGLINRDTVQIVVNSSPVTNAGNNQSICNGSSATIGIAPVPGNTYSWTSNPVGFTSAIANPSVSPVFTTQYFLQSTNAGGCSSKDTVIITVFTTPPVAGVTISVVPGTTICSGTNVTFTATPVNGGTSPSYQWFVNGVSTGTNLNTYTTNSLINGSAVNVIMTSSASCVLTSTATSNTIIMTVNNPINPVVIVSASATSVCVGTSVTFTATTTNGGTAPVYQWKVNGSNVGTNSITYNSSTLQSTDVVTVQMVSNAACANPTIVTSNGISVNVSSVTPEINISGSAIVIAGNSTLIYSNVQNAGSSPTYQWQDSTDMHDWQNINGGNGSTIDYEALLTGNKLRCILISNANCATVNSVTSNEIQFTINPNRPTGKIIYFPNPAKSSITIDSLNLDDHWETLSITGVIGQQIIILQDISGQTKVTLNLESILSGTYIITLRRKEGDTVNFKFIKL